MKLLYAIAIAVLVLSCSSSKELSSASMELSEAQELELKAEFLRANREKIIGNNEEALRLFRRCLLLNPNHSASLYEAARLEYYIGQTIVAINHLKKAVEIDPKNKWYKLELAEMYSSAGDYEKAAEVYEALIIQYPYNLEWKRQAAMMYIADGDFKEALKKYDAIEESYGVTEEVSIQKQKIHLERNDVDKAVLEMQKLIEVFPDETKYLAILAELYKKDGNQEMAIETFKRLEKKNPNNPYVQLSLSEYYSEVGETDKSYEALKKAFGNAELDIDTKIRYLLRFFALSNTDEELKRQAEELNDIVIEVHPDDPKAHAMMGDYKYRDKELEEARASYEKALSLDKNRFAIWNQLILIDSELEDYPKMIKHAKEATDLFPNQPLFFYLKAIGHIQLKEYKEAIKDLETGLPMAILNKSMAVQFHSSLGDCYYFTDQHEKSDKAYDSALELDEKNAYVLNNYSYFLSLRKEKLDKAYQMSKKCLSMEPNSSTYLDTHAWVLFQQGKYEEAKEKLDLALQNGGDSSGEILEHYGDVLFKLGQAEKALEYWKRAKENGQSSEELDRKIETGKLD